MIEFIQKEARLAQLDEKVSPSCVAQTCVDAECIYDIIGGSQVFFLNDSHQCVLYEFSGSNLLRNGKALNSSEVNISNGSFWLETSTHPMLNYSFDASADGRIFIKLQSGVSSRVY